LVDYEEVWDGLLNLLKSDEELASSIRDWLFGTPVRSPERFPHVHVQFEGGPIEPLTSGGKARDTMRFFIVVVDRHVDEDVAERSVVRLALRIRRVLESDRTLGGLVNDSRLTGKEMGVLRVRDYAVVGFRWTWEGYVLE